MASCLTCTKIQDVNSEQLDERRSQQILRQLEHVALESVLHAFRAQGPLTLYKEILLDHLKSALFISQDDYIFKVDHVVKEPVCERVCRLLNPSYHYRDANWLLERQSLHPHDFRRHMSRLGQNVTEIFEADDIKNEDVWAKMFHDFNADQDKALTKLLSIDKKPFVPEVLRQVLVNSEQSVRIDCRIASVGTQTGESFNNQKPSYFPVTANQRADSTEDDDRQTICEVANSLVNRTVDAENSRDDDEMEVDFEIDVGAPDSKPQKLPFHVTDDMDEEVESQSSLQTSRPTREQMRTNDSIKSDSARIRPFIKNPKLRNRLEREKSTESSESTSTRLSVSSLIQLCKSQPPFEKFICEQIPDFKKLPALAPIPNFKVQFAALQKQQEETAQEEALGLNPRVPMAETGATTMFGATAGRRTFQKQRSRVIRAATSGLVDMNLLSESVARDLIHLRAAEQLAALPQYLESLEQKKEQAKRKKTSKNHRTSDEMPMSCESMITD